MYPISPFTLVFDRFGFAFAASFINAIILTAVLSAGNSGLYSSTRMLYALAKKVKHQNFAKLNSRGVPVPALILTTAIGFILHSYKLYRRRYCIYLIVVNISGLCGFIAWVGIARSHYRFRRAFIAQGRDLSELPYKAWLFPIGPIFGVHPLRHHHCWPKLLRFHRRYHRLVRRIRCVHRIANLLRSILRLQIHQQNKTCSIERG